MAHIEARHRAGGQNTYRAQVRLKRDGRVIHQESRTFERRKHAETWAKQREVELEKPGGIERLKTKGMTLSELITRYRTYVESVRPMQRSKQYTLDRIGRSMLGNRRLDELAAADVIEYGRGRMAKGAGPSTIGQEVSWIGEILKLASPLFGLSVDANAVQEARLVLRKLKIIGRSKTRRRRLEGDEEVRLLTLFEKQDARPQAVLPMVDIVRFAIASAMRQSEITRICWEDLNENHRTVLVRSRKDPNFKEGRDEEVPLLDDAWDIVQCQPVISERIFPYKGHSIGTRFTRACQALGIQGLVIHDLRREGATRRLEQGYSVPEVIRVTGHRDWNQFARYVGLRPEDLHYTHSARSQAR